jgi:hypothetical protein
VGGTGLVIQVIVKLYLLEVAANPRLNKTATAGTSLARLRTASLEIVMTGNLRHGTVTENSSDLNRNHVQGPVTGLTRRFA